MAMKRGQLVLGCRRSCAAGRGGNKEFQSRRKVLFSLLHPCHTALPPSSTSTCTSSLDIFSIKLFSIITSGRLVTSETGTCSVGWASGTHQEP